MSTAEKVLAGDVVFEFARSLGYEPTELTEITVTPRDLTVSGFRYADGRVAMRDGHPIEWTETWRIDWSNQ